MGLYIQKNDNRSQLQQRLDEELRAKAKSKVQQDDAKMDGVEDSAYLKGTKQTTSLAWLWTLIIIVLIVIILLLFMRQ